MLARHAGLKAVKTGGRLAPSGCSRLVGGAVVFDRLPPHPHPHPPRPHRRRRRRPRNPTLLPANTPSLFRFLTSRCPLQPFRQLAPCLLDSNVGPPPPSLPSSVENKAPRLFASMPSHQTFPSPLLQHPAPSPSRSPLAEALAAELHSPSCPLLSLLARHPHPACLLD